MENDDEINLEDLPSEEAGRISREARRSQVQKGGGDRRSQVPVPMREGLIRMEATGTGGEERRSQVQRKDEVGGRG